MKLSSSPVMNEDRVFVSAYSLAQALQANVDWSVGKNQIIITSVSSVDEFSKETPAVTNAFNGIGMQPVIDSDGTKEFTLIAEPHVWEPIQGVVKTDALTYNGQVPGPVIRVTEGDHVRIKVKNQLNEPTTVHWHGLPVPNNMDGVPFITQNPIQPGDSFTYDFVASTPGTYMYHSHYDDMKQVGNGMYGAFIVDPKDPSKDTKYDHDYTMMLSGFHINSTMEQQEDYYTINGRSFPNTPSIDVKKGETVRVRLINIDATEYHTMHLHGMNFKVIAKDGQPIANPQVMNTVMIGPGETYDIAFQANNVGTWMFHCHILDHTMNGKTEGGGEMGGLITLVNVLPQ